MRTMSYRREMYCEDRYSISSTPENYKGDIPETACQESPSIRVSNVPQKNGEIKADMADYAQLNIFADESDTTLEFMDNYIKILRGELPEWKLFNVELYPGLDPCFEFINEESGIKEHLFIGRVAGLQIMFEIDRADGYTDKYLLQVERGGSCDGTSMVLTEYHCHGRYEIVFDGIGLCGRNSNDEQWKYVYVTEILY